MFIFPGEYTDLFQKLEHLKAAWYKESIGVLIKASKIYFESCDYEEGMVNKSKYVDSLPYKESRSKDCYGDYYYFPASFSFRNHSLNLNE